MNILSQAPAETTPYMIAGYAVIFGVMALYLVSLILRTRKLAQDLEALRQFDEEDQS